MSDEEIKEFMKEWKRIGFSSRCHFIENTKTHERVLIPICFSSLYEDDLDSCSCDNSMQKTTKSKQDLLQEITTLTQRIKELEAHNHQLQTNQKKNKESTNG